MIQKTFFKQQNNFTVRVGCASRAKQFFCHFARAPRYCNDSIDLEWFLLAMLIQQMMLHCHVLLHALTHYSITYSYSYFPLNAMAIFFTIFMK